MLNIELRGIGKKFNQNWLFRNVDIRFEETRSYAITGHNGSGKSTLLQIIYGYQVPSAGTVILSADQVQVAADVLYQHIAIAAPYMELPEELTLQEILSFHFSFKQKTSAVSFTDMIAGSQLSGSENKQVKYFSSGMKQRLKLVLAFYNPCNVLLLDEPCSNLDEQGISWYKEMILQQKNTRTIIIASNQVAEYDFCDELIRMDTYKV